jgi:hypothetical protein
MGLAIPTLPPPGCRLCKKAMVETYDEVIFLCPRCDRAPRPPKPDRPKSKDNRRA